MTAGTAVTYTIPACIEDGYYLVRHETIALHSAWAYPGAQVYPGCHQLEVSGGGSTAPSGLVSFPGAYKPTDPGITYDAYRGTLAFTLHSTSDKHTKTSHSRRIHHPRPCNLQMLRRCSSVSLQVTQGLIVPMLV
jgi:hypothetical protein